MLTALLILALAAPPRLDVRAVDALATRWWQARPQTCFEEWEPDLRARLLTEADQLGPLPEGQFDELVELLWKGLRKHGPHAKDPRLDTPFGKATWLVKGKGGKGKGLVLGLHGGGEGAGSAAEATRWTAKDCMGLYPQGIRLVHDTWNTVHGERFLLTLLEIAKVQHEVDPDRVYAMGFSMGGTGSWFLAGRHPDLIAAAAPCCGVLMAQPKSQLATKEEVELIQHGLVPNVRNVPLYYYACLKDRNCMPGTYLFVWDVLRDLQQKDPGGYADITFRVFEDLAHEFPPGEPEGAIQWIGTKRRDALPKRIVWEYASDPYPLPEPGDPLGRLTKRWYYWLHCADPKDRMLVRARRAGNEFWLDVERGDPAAFSILLNASMIDPRQDVIVRVSDRVVYRGRPEPTIRNVLESLDARVDRRLVFDRRIDLADALGGS